jgi:hypothetical protein
MWVFSVEAEALDQLERDAAQRREAELSARAEQVRLNN